VTTVKGHPAVTVKGDPISSAGLTVKETRQPLFDFLDALEGRGIRLVLRRNRVNAGAQQKLLTPDERVFMNKHRAALKELLQNSQRVQRESMAAPLAEPEPEPEPVVWTWDYERRITAADVEAARVSPTLSRQKAYERARDWLKEQAEAQAAVQHVAAIRVARDYGLSQRSFWEEVS